ncbi:LRR domain containing protein [Trema orientale]|uniref:LRR domain containing protein n=1 Tax=Trema orientale TaxID=63057 RepID=A0A2P5CNQ1_TREOI|nr:LRR domain containing protein [Trema orientale]
MDMEYKRGNLMYLDLHLNFLTAFHYQPSAILPWINLRILDVSSNELQGPLPIPPPSTWRYDVSNNLLTGEISL